ncbi:MAG: oligosaccharide flippase family protein [Bacteroidota bacterium]
MQGISLKKNIIFNYISQIYVTLIGIFMVPFYIKYLGAEAYGLVGFFAMLQGWFQLLDMGLTPTIGRETARFNGGGIDALSLRRLLRALEGVFVGVAILGALAMVIGSSAIAREWLKVQQLSLGEVENAIMLMAIIVALRWIGGLYRGAINGFERMIWLAGFNTTLATMRFVFVIPFFIYVGATPTHFFGYQLVLAIAELSFLIIKTYDLFPKLPTEKRIPWEWKPLRDVLRFSLSIAFTGATWVLVTQTDKLVLSKLLPLGEYAYFTLAVLAASGVTVISGPISGALLPRLTRLSAADNDDGLIQLYRNATQLIALIALPASLMLAFFAKEFLWVWTGNIDIANDAAPVLRLYALGNGVLALGAFPYYLQFAKGDLKLHLLGSGLFVLLLIPSLIWATLKYGAVGAGCAWLGANAIYFMCWVPIVHERFFPRLHIKWLLADIAPIFVISTLLAFATGRFVQWPNERLPLVIVLVMLGGILVMASAAGSSWVRSEILKKWRIRFSG